MARIPHLHRIDVGRIRDQRLHEFYSTNDLPRCLCVCPGYDFFFGANSRQSLGPSADLWLSLLPFLHALRQTSTRPSKDDINFILWAFSHYTF
jgi:hypothetical protein